MNENVSKVVDITGNRYGRLVVLGFSHTQNYQSYWTCRCDCGKVVTKWKSEFAYRSSKTRSCGCLRKELSSERAMRRNIQRGKEREARYAKSQENAAAGRV